MIHSDGFDTIISSRAAALGARVKDCKSWDGYDEFRQPSFDHYTTHNGCPGTKILIVSQPYSISSRCKALVLAADEEPFIPEGYVPPRMPPYKFPAEPTVEEYLASPEMQEEARSRYGLA